MSDVSVFRRAVEAADLPVLLATLSPSVVLHSPVLFRPFEGRDAAAVVLAGVMRVLADFRYTAQFASDDEHDGHVVLFSASVDGLQLQGVDILRLGDDGLVAELTVMMRPYAAVTRLRERMAALLTG